MQFRERAEWVIRNTLIVTSISAVAAVGTTIYIITLLGGIALTSFQPIPPVSSVCSSGIPPGGGDSDGTEGGGVQIGTFSSQVASSGPTFIAYELHKRIHMSNRPDPISQFPALHPSLSSNGSQLVYELWENNIPNLYLVSEPETNNTSEFLYEGRSPIFSSIDNTIAFISCQNGNADIYIDNISDEVEPQALVTSPGDDISPAWSPDGETIAYVSTLDDSRHICIIDIESQDGTGTCLTNQSNNELGNLNWEPEWSPDGEQILFVSAIGNKPEVYIMDIDKENHTASGLQNLTNSKAKDRWPAWSPDGSEILFTSNRDKKQSELYIIDSNDHRQITRLTINTPPQFDKKAAFWFSNQEIIYYVVQGNSFKLYCLNINGLETEEFAPQSSQQFCQASQP